MHEHGIAGDIVHVVMHKCRKAAATRVERITIQVSELSGMTEAALQMALDHACEEHGIEPFEVQMVKNGLLGHCRVCETLVEADDAFNCRVCGNGPVRVMADEGMLLLDCQFS